MNNEPNKPIPAQELTEKELEGVNGGGILPITIPDGDKILTELDFEGLLCKSKGQFE